jgi:hypothetical protein
MIKRDRAILEYLEKFRVLSRDQIAALVCPEVANPKKTANRICKRLARDGYLTIVPQPREKQYLYMPKPPIIKGNIDHFLEIAQLYIALGMPEHFDVEPRFNDYEPDVYTTVDHQKVCIEVQRSRISDRKMQSKVDEFMMSYYMKQHEANILWIYSSNRYDVKASDAFIIKQGKEW